MHEPANTEQLRLLISLCKQVGIPYDPTELASLTKWQAAERITALRGRPSSTPEELDVELTTVLQARVAQFRDAEPQPDPDPAPAKERSAKS